MAAHPGSQTLITAPLGKRFLALVIDLLIGFAIGQAIFSAFGQEFLLLDQDVPLAGRVVNLALASTYNIVRPLYGAELPENSSWACTSATNAARVTPWTATLRHLAFSNFYISSVAFELGHYDLVSLIDGLVYLVSLIMLLPDTEERRALHDRIAGTRVLQGSVIRRAPQPSVENI